MSKTIQSTDAMREEMEKRLRPQKPPPPPEREDVRRLALSRMAPDELEPVYDTAGHVTSQTKRANVFRTLSIGKNPVLSNNQAVYGQQLVEIYAAWKGAEGQPEFDGLKVRVSGGDIHPSNDRRLENRDLYHRIMTYVGPTSARLLTALCDDWVLGDGRTIESKPLQGPYATVKPRKPLRDREGNETALSPLVEHHYPLSKAQMRWRGVVERVCGEKEADRQSVYVKVACRDLESWFMSWRAGT